MLNQSQLARACGREPSRFTIADYAKKGLLPYTDPDKKLFNEGEETVFLVHQIFLAKNKLIDFDKLPDDDAAQIEPVENTPPEADEFKLPTEEPHKQNSNPQTFAGLESEGGEVNQVDNALKATDNVETRTLAPSSQSFFLFQGINLANVGSGEASVYTPDPNMSLEGRAEIIRKADKIEKACAVIIGKELIAAKSQVKHGDWTRWLAEEFGWKERLAQNYMQIARRFGSLQAFETFSKSALDAMLALPVGDEEDFIEEQAAAGTPVEEQSAREVQTNVKKWNDEHPKEIPLFGDVPANENPSSSAEPKGEYINATGAEKNNAIVDELNGDSGTAPAEKKNSPLPVAIVIVLDETSSAAIRKCLGDGELKFFKVGTRKAFELSGDVDEIAACLIGDGIKIKIYKEENNEIQN